MECAQYTIIRGRVLVFFIIGFVEKWVDVANFIICLCKLAYLGDIITDTLLSNYHNN